MGEGDGNRLLLMGRKAEGGDEEVLGKINGCVGRAIGKWWKRRARARGMLNGLFYGLLTSFTAFRTLVRPPRSSRGISYHRGPFWSFFSTYTPLLVAAHVNCFCDRFVAFLNWVWPPLILVRPPRSRRRISYHRGPFLVPFRPHTHHYYEQIAPALLQIATPPSPALSAGAA